MTSSVLALLLLLSSCAGKPALTSRRTTANPRVEKIPAQCSVSATRVGSAVRLAIVGDARGHTEDGPFEKPDSWNIRCWLGTKELRRVVNGSAKVRRRPVGAMDQQRWDVTVNYSVAFEVPASAAKIRVKIEGPDAVPFNQQVAISAVEAN